MVLMITRMGTEKPRTMRQIDLKRMARLLQSTSTPLIVKGKGEDSEVGQGGGGGNANQKGVLVAIKGCCLSDNQQYRVIVAKKRNHEGSRGSAYPSFKRCGSKLEVPPS